LQRYFLLPVRKIINLSDATRALISRFSDLQTGQQLREKFGINRAALLWTTAGSVVLVMVPD
jgi:hypothetical protein